MTDIWITEFDHGTPRTTERQLCLLRDAARRLDRAAALGDENLIAAARRDVNRTISDTDLLLSGIIHGRAGK
jgi:hypothetical protein